MKIQINGKNIELSQKIDGTILAVSYYGFTLAEALQDFFSRILKIKS